MPVCPDEEKTHLVEGPDYRFTGLCEHHVLPIRAGVHGSVTWPKKNLLVFETHTYRALVFKAVYKPGAHLSMKLRTNQ